MKKSVRSKGFTLLELLVVIAIIGVLSAVVLASLNTARARARDTKRLEDMTQIQKALSLYLLENGRYPSSDNDGCGNWDVGNSDFTLFTGRGMEDYLGGEPRDMSASGDCNGYRYYRYGAGSNGCDSSRGAFYVLGVTNMETSNRPHPDSPGWSCPGRDWQGEMDWVTGMFEG